MILESKAQRKQLAWMGALVQQLIVTGSALYMKCTRVDFISKGTKLPCLILKKKRSNTTGSCEGSNDLCKSIFIPNVGEQKMKFPSKIA